MILPPVVLPTLAAFAPRLSITAQLTRPAYNFTGNNYSTWASSFELFLESHNLHHHIMEDPPPLRDPSYASWSQSDLAIITWMLHSIEQNIVESLARIKPARSLWQTLETMYANQTNIGRVVEIFETLLTLKQGNLFLQAHFGRMQALIQEVDLYQRPTTDVVTLKHYRAELYVGIYLSGLRPSIASQLRGSLLSGDHVHGITTIFSTALRVTTGMPLLPLSSTPGNTPPPSTMDVCTPRACDDGGLSPLFDGNPPRGRGRNLFPPCPHCGKQNHPVNKCWKQFGKPPIAQVVFTPPTPPNIPAPQYHVTLTPAEYDALRRFASTDASSSASLASLPAPSTSSTSALLASSSPSWIIDSGASSHMTGTSSLLSSYHHTPSHPPLPLSMADLVRSKAMVLLVSPLLFLFTKSSLFLASLSTFSLLVLSLGLFPVQLPSFPFIVFSRICIPDGGLFWAVRTGGVSMSSLLMNSHRVFKLFLLPLLLLPPFCDIPV